MKIAAFILIVFALSQVEGAFRSQPAAARTGTKDFSFYVFTSEWAGSVCSTNSCVSPHSKGVSKNFWNIHGLWPSDGKMGINFCSEEKFDIRQISHLKTDLASFWSGLYSSADSFHSHEWLKHGTCSRMSQADYFSTAMKIGKNVNVFSALQSNKIVPGGVYNCQDVANAIRQHLKINTFTLQSVNGYLTSLKLCVDKDLRLINCPSGSICSGRVQYPNLNL